MRHLLGRRCKPAERLDVSESFLFGFPQHHVKLEVMGGPKTMLNKGTQLFVEDPMEHIDRVP